MSPSTSNASLHIAADLPPSHASSAGTPMAYIDGQVVPLAEARVPITDRGFVYGDSVYEVFRTYRGVPMLGEAHMVRLFASARRMGMTIGQSREEIWQAIEVTVAAMQITLPTEAFVRFCVTRGDGPLALQPPTPAQTRLVVWAKPFVAWPEALMHTGVALAVPEVRRNPECALSPNIKSGNYLNNVLGVMQAKDLGCDDALFLNPEGEITEAGNSNIFFALGDGLVTPPIESGTLDGLTKGALMQACEAAGISCRHTQIFPEDLRRATECFVTSATREVMPVRSVRLQDGDMCVFPAGGGRLTQKAQALYQEAVQANIAREGERKLVSDML